MKKSGPRKPIGGRKPRVYSEECRKDPTPNPWGMGGHRARQKVRLGGWTQDLKNGIVPFSYMDFGCGAGHVRRLVFDHSSQVASRWD